MPSSLTLVISDLHVGGGRNDPGDDHVYGDHELVTWLATMGSEPVESIEVVINGDFLEFAQVAPQVYRLGSAAAWCSEQESLDKLDVIIDGHRDIFTALRDFQGRGRFVTIAPGNHDVDLYWERVQARLRDVAGDVRFVTGHETLRRHGGRAVIGHGHVHDPANAFTNWVVPFVDAADGRRLEMCPGTLFMVKFINGLEASYPFADNIKPISQFARLLLRQGVWEWAPVAWAILKFARHGGATLSSAEQINDVPKRLRELFVLDKTFRLRLTTLYQDAVDAASTEERLARLIQSDDALQELLALLALRVPPEALARAFEPLRPATAAVVRSGLTSEKDNLWRRAREQFMDGVTRVLVFGHTHQPDERTDPDSGGLYINPGSWTRYVELKNLDAVTLEDLRDETRFPYRLNWVRIEETAAGTLGATLECFKRQP